MTRFAGALDMFELPYDDKGFRLGMVWHPRNHADPAVSWLRSWWCGRAGLNGARPAIPKLVSETKFQNDDHFINTAALGRQRPSAPRRSPRRRHSVQFTTPRRSTRWQTHPPTTALRRLALPPARRPGPFLSAAGRPAPQTTTSYVVRAGDSPRNITTRFLKSIDHWP